MPMGLRAAAIVSGAWWKTDSFRQDFEPISGAGEGGYFHNNRNRYAELMVWTAKHSLDLQVSVPSGRTAEVLKPDLVALANAIIAKLPELRWYGVNPHEIVPGIVCRSGNCDIKPADLA